MNNCNYGILSNYSDNIENPTYVGGLFPKGYLSAVVGESSIGKSLLVLTATMPGKKHFYPINPLKINNYHQVLLIETESKLPRYVKYLNKLQADLNCYYTPYSNTNYLCNFNDEQDRQQIISSIKSIQPEVLIVDSITAFCEGEIIPYSLQWLSRLASKYNIAVAITNLLDREILRRYSLIYRHSKVVYEMSEPNDSNKKIKQLTKLKDIGQEPVEVKTIFEFPYLD